MLRFFLNLARLLAGLMGASLVMAAWSEFVFFNEEPSHTLIAARDTGLLSAIIYIGTLGAFYLVPASFLVGLTNLSGGFGVARIFLLGALTGFSIEGAMVPAVYEAVPLSFLWTSVAWHGPITVGAGMFLVPRLASATSPLKLAGIAAIIGLGWGLWTTWTWGPDDLARVAPAVFQEFAAMTAATMALGYGLLWAARWPWMVLPRWASSLLILPSTVLFVIKGAFFPVEALALFATLGTLALGLVWLGPKAQVAYRYKWPNIALLTLIPVTAMVAYRAFYTWGPPLGAEDLTALTALAGLTVWGIGVLSGVLHKVRTRSSR